MIAEGPRGSSATRMPDSVQPARQKAFDLAAAARRLQPSGDRFPLDHDERRDPFDPEALEQIGAFFLRNLHDLEGGVIPPALQDLGEESFDAPTVTRVA